ncbi:hypothetical protein [Streptomyces sp. NBC_01281]|uniref:hypothetical protein n=1 Tax=Streptomyces sp. NBC_01281 TaxID=2903811 RepID=UPI003DA46C09
MNQYGQLVRQHWREFRPGRLAEIDDPEALFTELGADVGIEDRGRWAIACLSASGQPGEGYREGASRLEQVPLLAKGEAIRAPVLFAEKGFPRSDDHRCVAKKRGMGHRCDLPLLLRDVSQVLPPADVPLGAELTDQPAGTAARRRGDNV